MHINEEDLSELKTDIRDIKNAVIGNDEIKQVGLITRVERLEVWQQETKLRVAKILGGCFVVSAIAQGLFMYLTSLTHH